MGVFELVVFCALKLFFRFQLAFTFQLSELKPEMSKNIIFSNASIESIQFVNIKGEDLYTYLQFGNDRLLLKRMFCGEFYLGKREQEQRRK